MKTNYKENVVTSSTTPIISNVFSNKSTLLNQPLH